MKTMLKECWKKPTKKVVIVAAERTIEFALDEIAAGDTLLAHYPEGSYYNLSQALIRYENAALALRGIGNVDSSRFICSGMGYGVPTYVQNEHVGDERLMDYTSRKKPVQLKIFQYLSIENSNRTGENSGASSYSSRAVGVHHSYAAAALKIAISYTSVGLRILGMSGSSSYTTILGRKSVSVLALALAFCKESCLIAYKARTYNKDAASSLDLAWAHNNLGRALLGMRSTEMALKHFKLALAISVRSCGSRQAIIPGGNVSMCHHRSETVAQCYTNIANAIVDNMPTSLAYQSEALRYYHLALDICEAGDLTSLTTAKTHSDLASFLHEKGDLDASLHHFLAALVIRKDHAKRMGAEEITREQNMDIIHTCNNMALVLRDLGRVDAALHYLHEALERANKASYLCDSAWILGNIGRIRDEIYIAE